MWKTGKTSFLNNVDYLCKGIKDEVLRGNILEVVLSVTIKDANTVAICACVAELMIKNPKNWSKSQFQPNLA